jgi:hypothetical protein
MKTIKFLFTVMAVAVAAIVTGVEKPKMDLIPITAERAIVSITNENPALFEVSIETVNGGLVYYKQSSDPITDYRKIYDFADLEEGRYVLNLKVNDTKVSNEFEVTRNEILIGQSKMRFDPFFNFDNDVLKISYLNFDQENLKLNFYNEEGLVYETKIGRNFNISTGYDLSRLEKGSYRVVLSSFNKGYAFEIEK